MHVMQVSPKRVDLLVKGIGELVTGKGNLPSGGAALGVVERLSDAAVAVHEGLIVDVGKADELCSAYEAAEVIDARGGVVLPGFVDAHTHPVFAGTREGEFEQRLAGKSYVEIAAAGGGISSASDFLGAVSGGAFGSRHPPVST